VRQFATSHLQLAAYHGGSALVGVGAEVALVALEEFFLAVAAEINAARAGGLKIRGGEDVLVEQVQGEAVDEGMAKFFQQVKSQTGAAIFGNMVKAGIGIEADAVEVRLQFIADDDVAEGKHGVDGIFGWATAAGGELPGR